MSRWLGFAVICLMAGGTACHEAGSGPQPGVILDQLATREAAYYATVGALTDAIAVRCETATYARDMHALLDSLRESCRESGQGGGMMGGYTSGDMIEIIDQMETCIDAYVQRVKSMQLADGMLEACEEHHAVMNEMVTDMRGMLGEGRS
jgi:hypothetical protein